MGHRAIDHTQPFILAAALFITAGQACSNRGEVAVGGKCRLDESCVTGVCLPEARSAAGVSWSQGYCSGKCSQDGRPACPQGRCVALNDGLEYCLSTCSSTPDCRDGYVCSEAVAACVPDCRLGWDCGRLACNARTGECGVAAAKPVGAACEWNAECLSGLCIAEQREDAGVAWTAGSCSLECTTAQCPANSTCVGLEDGSSYCVSNCTADMDCREGYVCSSLAAACLPDCRLGWPCGTTLACDGDSGACVASAPPDAGLASADAALPVGDAQTPWRGTDAGGRGPGPGPGGVWSLLRR
jgi:hypothetical protein